MKRKQTSEDHSTQITRVRLHYVSMWRNLPAPLFELDSFLRNNHKLCFFFQEISSFKSHPGSALLVLNRSVMFRDTYVFSKCGLSKVTGLCDHPCLLLILSLPILLSENS